MMAAEEKSARRKQDSLDSSGSLLDLLPCPIGLWTRNFSHCRLNEPARRLIHCSESDSLHLGSFWLNHVHDDDRERYSVFREQLKKSKLLNLCDYRIRRRDANKPVWIREVSIVTNHHVTRPWEIRSAYTDISDLKREGMAGGQLGIAPQFLENVVHDLQNRLHVLSMELELARSGVKDQIDPTKFLNIVGSVKHSVQNLSDCVASIEGDLSLLDPAEILANVLSSMRKELSRRRINLRLVRRAAVPRVHADKDQLCSAFERIIEFCGALLKKGGELNIEAGTKRTSDQVFAEFKITTTAAASFEFVDRGEGQASQPYMNLKVEDQGVGVTLNLAAEILRRYQGQVSLRKENRQQDQVTVLIGATLLSQRT